MLMMLTIIHVVIVATALIQLWRWRQDVGDTPRPRFLLPPNAP